MSDKLKPCPFCGGEAQMEKRKALVGEYAVVECQDCEAEVQGSSHENKGDCGKLGALKWNTRAEIEAKNTWRKYPEEVPEDDIFLIALAGNEVVMCEYKDDNFFIANKGWVPCEGVTHWQPLPEPPKEKNKNDNV